MNTLILEPDQFTSLNTASLSLRQSEHIRSILKSDEGSILNVGMLNGKLGHATLVKHANTLSLSDITLEKEPPLPLAVTLILALPRPQMLKRILQTVTMFGVEKLILIQSNRVEKSFWQSPSATDTAIREQLILGLEQAKATQLPKIFKFKRFKPFIEDACAQHTDGTRKIIAQPGDYPFSPIAQPQQKLSIAIGPEGGFTDFEIVLWQEAGFSPVQLGQRIFKVETAVTALLARLL